MDSEGMATRRAARVARSLAGSRLVARGAAALPAALLAAGAILRFVNLGGRQLFRDEAASWLLAGYPLGAMLDHARFEAYPPLYSIVLSAWIGLFGDSEAALRSLSVLAGLATLGVVWAWARETLGRAPACVALALAALSVILIDDARDARMYAIETAFATASWWLIWRLLTLEARLDRRRRTALLTAAALAIAVAGELWTLALGLPTAGLQVIVVGLGALAGARARLAVLDRPSPRIWTPRGLAGAIAAVPRGPGLAIVALAIGGATFLVWLPNLLAVAGNGQPFWTGRPGPDALYQTLNRAVSTTGQWDATVPAPFIAFGLAVMGTVGLLGIRRPQHGSEPTAASTSSQLRWFGIALIFAASIVPVVWLYSQVRPIYDTRYMGSLAPPLCLLIAAGLTTLGRRLRSRALPSILLIALVSMMASGAIGFVQSRSVNGDVNPAQETAAQLVTMVRPGDVVLTVDARTYFPIDYYLARAGGEKALGIELYDWYGPEQPFFYGTYLIPEARVIRPSQVDEIGWARALPGLEPGGTIWLVTIGNGDREDIGFAPLSTDQLVERSRLLVPGSSGSGGRYGQIHQLTIPGS
jgi:4-amino-4-deoxy-L-arabinose transferase-like glycosyltransferase